MKSRAIRILVALGTGLMIGIFAATRGWAEPGIAIADPIGTLWLNGLRMTIVPLVVALLITGIAATAEAARAGRTMGLALAIMYALLWASAITAAIVTPLLLDIWPLDPVAGRALSGALSGTAPAGDVPPFGDFVRQMVPTNPVSAAANDAFLPLIIFTAVFAFAVTRLPPVPRKTLTDFFAAVGDAMLIVINWVLFIAPIGVFALAFVVGARAGTSAFGALLHYVLIVTAVGTVIWLAAYPIAMIGGRRKFPAFAVAVAPAQALAISTQSSLASMPATLRAAKTLAIPDAVADVVLPFAPTIFRVTGPAMNLAVAIYIAHWFGIALSPQQLAIGVAVAATTTLGAVSLPGQVSFITSIAPISLAMGVPFEPLALLVAVEALPDIMRTLGNVTMNVAVAATVAERVGVTDDAPIDGEREIGTH